MIKDTEEEPVVDSVIEAILEKILIEQEISNYKITYEAGSKNGDNYLGVIIRTLVNGFNKEGSEITRNFILKCAHTSEGYRKLDILETGYSRESYVYAKLHPFFRKFQLERNILKPFSSYPRCYAHTNEKFHEALIMEDMAVKGYRMQNRLKPLNVHHCKLVMRELAKWHALSFAFRDQEPDLYKKHRHQNKGWFVDKSFFEGNLVKRIRDLETAFDPIKEKHQLTKFKEITATSIDDMFDLVDPEAANGYEVILHGDCWINNMLFQYENPEDLEHPSKVCFLDWQVSRIGSPLIDIFYFLYNSTEKQLRNEYFDEIMQDYYNSLSSFLRELGSNVKELYPEAVFKQDMKKFGRWALGICFIGIPIMTTDSKDMPNFAKEAEAGAEAPKLMEGLTTSEYSKRRMKDCFLHLYDNGFLE